MVGVAESSRRPLKTAIDLDVDIGADAVDYSAIAKQGTSFIQSFTVCKLFVD
jgi:hypothetical protein